MSVKTEGATSYIEQDYYPCSHILFLLAMIERLIERVPDKSGQVQLADTGRMKLYWELTAVEIFLLETFLIDGDWARIQGKFSNSIALQFDYGDEWTFTVEVE